MQFLIVRAKKAGSDELLQEALPVLINSEENGQTGSPIKLDAGTVDISIKHVLSEVKAVTVENTTQENPMEVIIEVGEEDI